MTDIDFAFKKEEIEALAEIIQKRRDVRGNRFLEFPVSEEIISAMLSAANSAPSVGFSQPWEFVIVESIKTREKIHKEFKKQNKKANRIFKDSTLYSSLKLEGILDSYINIAFFYIKPKKAVLGQTAQKRVGEYSVKSSGLSAKSVTYPTVKYPISFLSEPTFKIFLTFFGFNMLTQPTPTP